MINGKAYLLARKPIEGMHSVVLDNGMALNWYDGVNVVCSDDKKYALIGDCWSIKKDEDPARFLRETAELSAETVLEHENCWCGRYVLILEDAVYMDASGMMNVFYHADYVSNSLNLIREKLGYSLKKEKIYDELSPDFVPGVATQYDGVKRLLPSLVYHIKTQSVTLRPLLPEYPLEFSSDEERMRAFVDEFVQGLKNLDAYYEGKTKLVVCTGGRDSRTVLALSEYAGLHYDTCTLEHGKISEGDVEIPARLSGALHRKRYYIRQEKERYQESRLKEFDRHTCNYIKDADRMFYAYGQYEELRRRVGGDIVLLRGSVWGIAIDYYRTDSPEYTLDNVTQLFPLIGYNRGYMDSVREWWNYTVRDHDNQKIKMSDRVFWELREGCWCASIEQCFDIYEGITSVQPVNCRRLIALLLGFDIADRGKKLHEEKITRFACPAFAEFPYDYQQKKTGGDSGMKRYALYAKKAWWLLRNYGPGAVMYFIRHKQS